ncbi:MAG: T9SS type A sorting domain-containing protein [Ignavibacteriae bacterium]|nr:T9SS C-terminal target domain-containing protein [Ignavibacteriota bacterium]NOG97351.1 T9SS type A sorting domain-containing protein [Ignavibacteriota bacterium]
MSKYRALIVLGIFIFITAQSKSQTVFPLAIGNTWQYEINYYLYFPPISSRTFTYSVVGDTIMTNGKTYYQLSPRNMFDEEFIRSDSNCVYYWSRLENKEILVFDTTVPPDSEMIINWGGFITATSRLFNSGTLFGEETNFYSYALGGLLFGDIKLADKFGYASYEYRADTEEIDYWSLKGCIINDTLYGTITDVEPTPINPTEFTLHQNYPNPFNPTTTITFTLPRHGGQAKVADAFNASTTNVLLKIYDILGNEITTLVNEEKPPGTYEVEFDTRLTNKQGSSLSSGVYFYRLNIGAFTETMKFVLLK